MHRDMEDIKTQITNYMEENNISYAELAKRIGTSRQNVFRTLNSDKPLTLKSAEKFTEALGLKVVTTIL